MAPKTSQNDPRIEFYRFLMDFGSLWDGIFKKTSRKIIVFSSVLKFSACNTFFHGPGAGICRRQLRSAPGPLATRQSVSAWLPNRCSLFLHCTLTSHITLFFLYLFKVGDLQVPCDSSRAEWWGFGTPKNWRRPPKSLKPKPKSALFFTPFLKTPNFHETQ